MYTRNLRTVNADITENDLIKLKCKFRNVFSRQIILGVIKKDYYEVMKRKSWLKGNFFVTSKTTVFMIGSYGNLCLTCWTRPQWKESISVL